MTVMYSDLNIPYMPNKEDKKTKRGPFTVRDIVLVGMMCALLEGVKFALQSIPNVELVTFLIIMFSMYLGAKSLVAVWAFVGIECVIWGLGLWSIMYVYIWPILVMLTIIIHKYTEDKWAYVVLSTVFGLLFGALCTIPYFFVGGVNTAIAWWIAGIPYDILHGISNGVLMFVLFTPVNKVFRRLYLKEFS